MSDDYIEIIAPGAFRNTLPADVPLRLNFTGEPIGTCRVHEDGTIEFTITDHAVIRRIRGYP